MTHEDAGHYSAKHGSAATLRPDLAEAVRSESRENRLSCVAAHQLAEKFGVVPAEIGKTADLLEYRLRHCQMGLFGHEPEKKKVTPAEEVPTALAADIRKALENGKISCAACWRIAAVHNLPKMAVAAACETLDIKIIQCQLGAF